MSEGNQLMRHRRFVESIKGNVFHQIYGEIFMSRCSRLLSLLSFISGYKVSHRFNLLRDQHMKALCDNWFHCGFSECIEIKVIHQ